MPRLGSNFFNSYNKQIDRLRTRRKENVDAFNSFVKLRTELGETASVEDMEKFKNQLGGGDSYFLNALPTSTMIAETQKRLVANQADMIQTERQNALKTSDDELSLTEKIVGGLVNVDISKPEGQKALQEAFVTAGRPKLGEQYADLIPNMHENARLTETSKFAASIGFDNFTTEESTQNAIAQAPTWMHGMLGTRATNNINSENTRKINDAKTSITANFGEMINDAGGDINSMKKAVKAELKLKLGKLYDDAILEELMGAAEGQMGMDTARRRTTALAKVEATDEELLAAGTNEAQLRILAKNALVEQGYPNPSPDDIDQAVETLRGQVVTARTKDYNAKVEDAVTQAEALTDRQLEQIDGDDDIDKQVETILKGQFGEDAYNALSESQRARAEARVKAIVANNSRLANDADQEEGEEAVNSAILIDKELKRISEMGPSKDKMKSIYERINTMRATKGLPRLNDEQIEQQYGGQIKALFNVGASTRYEKEIKTATDNATANVAAITEGHKAQMEMIAGRLPAEWSEVAAIMSINYIPRSAAGYAAYQSTILHLSKKKPPESPEEAYAMANNIASSLGWLPAANAKQVLIAEELAEKDLIRPDTPVEEFLTGENALMSADIQAVVATISMLPMDDLATSQNNRDIARQQIDAWERGLIMDMNSTSITPLLTGLDGSTAAAHNQTVTKMANELREMINQSTSTGQYSFMTHFKGPDGGYYNIPTTADPEKVRQYGFELGATYKKTGDDDDGRPIYEKVLNPVVTADGAPVSQAGTQGTAGVQQINPNSSPFVQDIQGIGAEMDITKRLRDEADDMIRGRDGYAGTALSGQISNYFFGDQQSPEQIRQRELDEKVAQFLRSPEAIQYLRANPTTIDLMESDPYTWAAQAGLQ